MWAPSHLPNSFQFDAISFRGSIRVAGYCCVVADRSSMPEMTAETQPAYYRGFREVTTPLPEESRRIYAMFQPPALQFQLGRELDRTKRVNPGMITNRSPLQSSTDSRVRSLISRLTELLGTKPVRFRRASEGCGAELRLQTRSNGSDAIGDSLRESPIATI